MKILVLGASGGVAVSPSGDVFIADRDVSLIRKFRPGGAIATVIGHLTQPDLGPDEQLIFLLSDSGEPDGSGDMWGSTVTNGATCAAPLPGGQPIVGNITIHVP